MTNIFTIARWEWFKLQRRKMPWILLAILFVIAQLTVWGPYISYSNDVVTGGSVFIPFRAQAGALRMTTCSALLSNPSQVIPADAPPDAAAALLARCRQQSALLSARYRTFTPTGSISSALGIASTLGLILFGILSASTVGMEYGLGTLRPILARGTGRLSYLAGKYLLLIAVATAALLLICATAAGSGALAAHSVVPPPGGGGVAVAGSFGNVAISFVKTWAGVVTYVTMAGAITLLLRSTAAGMALSLGYYVAEGILIRLLSAAFSGFDKVADYLPMRNISALAGGRPGIASALAGTGSISTLHASLVLAAWVILFAGSAAMVFRRRDIAGAAGG